MTEIRIDEEFRGLIPQPKDSERVQLEANLKAEGCCDPLVVWPQDDGSAFLLDGHNRHDICTAHGIDYSVREVQCADRDDAKLWIIQNQLGRRNITSYARMEIVANLKPAIEEKAKQRQLRGLSHAKDDDHDQGEPINTREILAKMAGVSEGTMRKGLKIVDEASEEQKQKLRNGELSVDGVFKELEKKKERPKTNAAPSPPEGPDPDPTDQEPCLVENRQESEWSSSNKAEALLIDREHLRDLKADLIIIRESWDQGTAHVASIPVGDIAGDHAIVSLWTTNDHLFDAPDVLRSWGFRPLKPITWAKPEPQGEDWIRDQTEHCIVAVKGSPRIRRGKSVTTSLRASAAEHHAGPNGFFKLLETVCDAQTRVFIGDGQVPEGWTRVNAADLHRLDMNLSDASPVMDLSKSTSGVWEQVGSPDTAEKIPWLDEADLSEIEPAKDEFDSKLLLPMKTPCKEYQDAYVS